MNYCEARQLKDTGRWNWTRLRDGDIFTAGNCINHPEGHSTKEEAEKCFYDYEISKLYEIRFSLYDKCVICKAITDKALTPDGYQIAHLCKKHRTKEYYIKAFPFQAGRQIISS